MFLTMGLLFVPKMIYVLRAARKGDMAEGADDQYAAATSRRASVTGDTTHTGAQARAVPNYTEFSESDNSDSEYEAVGALAAGDSMMEGTTNRPDFISQNISRGSTTMNSGTMTGLTSAGSGTAPTSYLGGDTGFTSEATGTGTNASSGFTGMTSAGTRTTAGDNDMLSGFGSGSNTAPSTPGPSRRR
jgi:hypothetical protein